jgi:hypothetical protein
MSDPTTAEMTQIVTENDQLIDVLTEIYRRSEEHDRALGVTEDDGALGAVGLALEAVGYHELTANLMMLICLAVRRLAKSEPRHG